MLEPYDGKLSRTVLRGKGAGRLLTYPVTQDVKRMYVDIEDWKNGWYGIGIGLAPGEIDELISLLQMIKSDPEQHFHISSEYQGKGGVGDIEIYVTGDRKQNNMFSSERLLVREKRFERLA